MSLRWRILGAFFLIIVLAIILSIGVGYFTTQSRLDSFVNHISSAEADALAGRLGQAWLRAGDWGPVDEVLAEAGYLYGEGSTEERGHDVGGTHESDEHSLEIFHDAPVRVVILDVNRVVVRDNSAELSDGERAPELGGQHATITDPGSGRTIGYVHVDVNHEYLATESHSFLERTLTTTIIGGIVTAVIALLLAFWLSRRITAPVKELTRATREITRQGDSNLLSVSSSDELGQMSNAFNQMTTALQTQRELRKRLIDDLSHELNTPLSVINLEAKGLHDGLQTPDLAAGRILQEVDMLRNLVRDLNWLAETDSGGMQLELEPSSIQQLLTTEVERWQPQAEAHQVSLSLEQVLESPGLMLDPNRMSQAISNIIHNALQHTDANGHVVVSSAMEAGGILSISVTDDGVGIDPVDVPHILDRYYRTDESRSRGAHGTGLGLAIARDIIEKHGGTIKVDSTGIGEGTTVRIELPVSAPR